MNRTDGTEGRYDKEAVRNARPWMEFLCSRAGVELRGMARRMVGRCPFHAERTGSFMVNMEVGTWYCFGCGKSGDVFGFFAEMEGLDVESQFPEVLRRMAGLCGMGPTGGGDDWKPRRVVKAARVERPAEGVVWPRLRRLADGTCEELAGQRGLGVAGVRAAREAGLIWGCNVGVLVPGRRVRGRTRVYGDGDIAVHDAHIEEVARCWVVYDGAQRVMQFRRLDGRKWRAWNGETGRREESFKSDTLGSSKWPQGCGLIGDRRRVVLVEGGPDLLAGFDFLERAGRLGDTAVVEAISASVRFDEEALRFFAGKRVRIFAHYDKLDAKRGTRAGWEASVKWMGELSEAGAEVDSWQPGPVEEDGEYEGLPGLWRVRGYPHEVDFAGALCGDLNDCALGDGECLRRTVEAMDFNLTIDSI